jgi:ACS family tartrate transporter-like MFS transporter
VIRPGPPSVTLADASSLDRARRKAYRRLIPLVFVSYVIAYIDRTNVGIAKLTMARDLGFDNEVFGTAAGIFFIGYFLLEIPGTLIVERWSARRWLGRIMISWGLVAALTAAVTTPTQFYAARFVLGLAEAGFFPGVIVYLTHWFPKRDRARALACFVMAQPVAFFVAPPLSAPLLRIGTTEGIGGLAQQHPQVLGLNGWQWVYMVWGVPAIVLGVIVLVALTDRPSQAAWLTADEREALEHELRRERAELGEAANIRLLDALRDPKVLLLALVNFLAVTGHYGVEFFLPTILQDWYGLPLSTIAWVIVVPFGVLLVSQLAVSWSSDRSGERWLHTALPMFVGAGALAAAPFSQGHVALTLLAFSGAMIGRSYLPPFYALPGLFLGGTAAAGGIGLINSIGNLGGFLGPYVLGAVQARSGSYSGGIYFLVVTTAAAGAIALGLRAWHGRTRRSDELRATNYDG